MVGENGEYLTREWWAPVEDDAGPAVSWWEILSHWDAIEADLHHYFQVDAESPVVRQRSWRWFTVRVKWLFGVDSALSRAFRPPPVEDNNTAHGDA